MFSRTLLVVHKIAGYKALFAAVISWKSVVLASQVGPKSISATEFNTDGSYYKNWVWSIGLLHR